MYIFEEASPLFKFDTKIWVDSLQIPFFQSSIDEADEQAENITDSIGRDQVIEVKYFSIYYY